MDLTKYKSKLIGNESERAVSPVIGVILMVAITVILAAVIATFVMGMGDDLGDSTPTTNVDANVNSDWDGDESGGEVELAYLSHSTGDSIDMENVRVVVRDDNGAQVASVDGADFEADPSEDPDSDGDVYIYTEDDEFDAGTTLTVKADSNSNGLEYTSSGGDFTLQVIDIPSSTTIHDTTHDLPESS
ncbi:type IV pilin [Natronorubrum sp. JWXQ-INN-674]|uniref:Type IV pilin n=1 Tax=Natronorubrum halalkaliphilum TaxID=2691917 RepID=A0A6B0VHH6_9EURY|nr:type IV pilin N-terminal domain-containing protein [Natronorubrum halalkaliphilum]MXV61291.1 type IV pilin [Natronorubrum halalkaliphilum]